MPLIRGQHMLTVTAGPKEKE